MQRSQLALGLLLALGLIVRILLGWNQPEDLLADNDGYLAHAKPVAAGAGFHGPYSHRPTAFRPPGYPVILGFLMACRLSDAMSVVVLSAVSYIVIFALTGLLALQMGIPQRWSLLAILGVVLDPLLIRYSILPMTEVPCAAILLAAMVAFVKFRSGNPANEVQKIGFGILAGVLFGIGTLFRPVVLVVCLFVTLHAILRPRERHPSSAPGLPAPTSPTMPSKGRLYSLLNVLIPAFVASLVLCPWIIRNAVQFRDFIPATTHGGYTLALGNNPDFYRDVINGNDQFPWDGAALDAWQQRMIQEAKSEGISGISEPATDAWYYSKAKAAILAEPRSFLKATVLRLKRFWAISTADSLEGNSFSMQLVKLWYVILWIGLLMQIAQLCLRGPSSRSHPIATLWLAILAFLVMHSVYWTDTRMRAPLMPIMIVIAVSGWQSASSYLHRRCVEGSPKTTRELAETQR